jgi:cytochrome c biogenesis protein
LGDRAARTNLARWPVTRLSTLYGDFVRTFGNVLFAVSLFVVWGILTLIGVIVDQGKDPAQYYTSYAPPIARAILRLNLDNVYHSPWYVGIIGLILVSLAVCTFKRVIPARLPRLHPVKIDKIPLHASFDATGDADAVRGRVTAFLAARGWQMRERVFGGIEWTFADKHNWARRGVLIAHLGFVIVAAGTTLYWARGFSGETAVLTGQAVKIPQTGAVLRLDRFGYKIAPVMTKSGMVYQPIDYVSLVTVTGNDGAPRSEIVRVNHPIDVDGTLYYQASYGFGMRFLLEHRGRRAGDVSDRTLFEGDSFQIPGTQRSVLYDRFVPTVDRQSGMPAADPRVNNAGVILSVAQGGNSLGDALVPLHTWIDVGDGWRVTPQRYVLYSGFQYRFDPGAPLVGIGAFVLLTGLVVSFYFLPARLYVRVDAIAPQRCRVGIAGTTVKGYDVFENVFNRLVVALKDEPGEPSDTSMAEADWRLATWS